MKSFGQVLTLDVWVINEDRHPGNILLVQGEVGYSPCFIDFGGAVVGYPGDFVMRTKYLPREAQFAARTVAPEMLIAGAYQALEEIKSLATSDIEGIVREACDIAGFSTDAGRLSRALLDRRNELPGLVRAFLARLGVNP